MAPPNPHKALGVKRKSFPRPRGMAFFLTPFSPGCSRRWRGLPLADPTGSLLQARLLAQGHRRTAPNTHADSGGPAPQSRAPVPGTVSWPVPILVRARLRGQSKAAGSPPPGRVQFGTAHGRGGSSGDSSFLGALRWGSGGPWDDASASSPYSLRQPCADLVLSPDPPPGRAPRHGPPRSVRWGAAGVPSKRQAAGAAAKDIPERTYSSMTVVCHRCG